MDKKNTMLVTKEKSISQKISDIFARIKYFFTGKKKNEIISNDEKSNEKEKVDKNIEDKQDDFKDTLKDFLDDKNNKKIDKSAFLEEIDGNEEMLNKLSIDRLEKLSDYYGEIIEKNKKKISDSQ